MSQQKKYDVFISSKSEDYPIAEKVYDFLVANGLTVFLASRELNHIGEAEYSEAVDSAIDATHHMIVVTTSIDNIKSKWVKHEWTTFANELRSNYKEGNLLTILGSNVQLKDLPITLRHKQSFSVKSYKENILDYLYKDKRFDDTARAEQERLRKEKELKEKIAQAEAAKKELEEKARMAEEKARKAEEERRVAEEKARKAEEEKRLAGEKNRQKYTEQTNKLSVKHQEPIVTNAVVQKVSTHNDHEFVDLGLSVKWATCNLGANKPWEFGDYFRWGEIHPYQCASKSFKETPLTLPLYADAAHVNWGIPWRMPTEQDFNELLTKCMWKWGILHGVQGCIVSGLNGNSIFLPAAGTGQDDWIAKFIFRKLGILQCGVYWSSTSNVDKKYSSDCVCGLIIESNRYMVGREYGRFFRYSIRPVCP